MQRRNTSLLIAALALVAIGVTVWQVAAGDPEPVPLPPNGGRGASSVNIPEGHTPHDGPPDRPEVAGAFDGPRVVVAVRSLEEFVPPPTPRVQARQLPNGKRLPTTMLAGTGANPWSAQPRPGVALVRIAVDDGFLVRQVGVEATEVRELGLGSQLEVTGSVRDSAGKPIAAARVWLGELDAAGKTRHVQTDELGAFAVRARASDGVPLVAWAPGYAAAWRPIRVDIDGGRDYPITLSAGGTLAVQLAGQTDNVRAAQIFVSPTATRDAELSRFPFFLQELVGGADVDANGRGSVTFLAQRGSLAITVVHPHVAIGNHHEVQLDGERTACTVPVAFLASWTGAVRNDADEPVAAASLLLRPEGRKVQVGSSLLLLPPRLAAIGCSYTESDGEGRFDCAAPSKGDIVSLRAAEHGGRDIEIGAVPPSSLWLPRWRGGELVLRLRPPIAGIAWRAQFDLGGGTVIDCAADEDAVVALPHAGLFDITTTSFVGTEQRGERVHTGFSATGEVVIQAAKIE